MSSKAIIAFDFEEKPLRTIERNGEPWFIMSDVCRVLDIKNVSQAAERLDADEKGIYLSDTPGGKQELLIVSEPGLYSLILRSNGATKPGTVAYRFRKFVTADLLPTVRKQGFYGERNTVRSIQARNAVQNQVIRVMEKLRNTRDTAVRQVLWDMLNNMCSDLGIATPEIQLLGKAQPAVPDLLTRFWALFDDLEADGIIVNLHRKPETLAINMPEVRGIFKERRIAFTFDRDFYKALEQSTDPLYLGKTSVNCRDGKFRACWLFQRLTAL
jgi:prophage antirepressor-like protein|nr:MAG TPA: hypothetical protein [Caudoviricetes sp.]